MNFSQKVIYPYAARPLLILLIAGSVSAQPLIEVCTAPGRQTGHAITTDGANGTIVVWQDERGIFAQRIDVSGRIRWNADGVPVSTSQRRRVPISITSDDQGGAIVVWTSESGAPGRLYAQRINGSGAIRWGNSSVQLCSVFATQMPPVLVSDGRGGAIVAWADNRSRLFYLYAQRLDGSGILQWGTAGIPICEASVRAGVKIISDGSGGAIIAWTCYRVESLNQVVGARKRKLDIYAQRVDAAGRTSWQRNGIPICSEENDQIRPDMVGDGRGGAIIVWIDSRESRPAVYAQHLTSDGNPKWTKNGIALCDSGSIPRIVADGLGGAIVVWHNVRNKNLRGQHLNASGVPTWRVGGIDISKRPGGNQPNSFDLIEDGAQGAIAVWVIPYFHAQRMDGTGVLQWGSYGREIGRVASGQPKAIGDGKGGAIVVWAKYPSNRSSRIVATLVN